MYELKSIDSASYHTTIQETAPDMPSAEHLAIEEQKCQEDTILHRVAALTPDGRMIGYGRCVSGPWDPSTKPAQYAIHISVTPNQRQTKLFDDILAYMVRFCRDHGARVATITVQDSDKELVELMIQSGFVQSRHSYSSILDLTKFNPLKFKFYTELQPRSSSTLRFATLAVYEDTDETFERFMDFYWKLAMDAPQSDGLLEDRDTMRHILRNVAPWEPKGIQLIIDGEQWVAMSAVIREPNNWFNCILTGVEREFRGRGLSTAVKAKSAEYAKKAGGEFLRTFNDSTNERILKVNQRMGFQAQSGHFTFEKRFSAND